MSNDHGARLKLVKSPIVSTRPAGSPSICDSENGKVESYMFETPEFERHEEATSIELFYDLFFVANLTTFTSLHEINGSHTLEAYAGFFCLLWFTWCQVSLFDIRYVSDGILERCLKSLQFAVMIGFALVGPKFNPEDQDASIFQALSLILAASRFVLAVQYLIVLYHVKKYKKSKTPIGLIALSSFIAGILYLGISFGFQKDKHTSIYIAWYVIAVFEIGFNIVVSSKWKVVSFKGTHLVQRMSLLTLIILGEGIISLTKSIAKIVMKEFAYTPATVGNIIASIAIIYFIYMLYFDWLNIRNHFGSIRQQIWAFLHFPFNLFLVLGLEGTSQVIIVRKLEEVQERISDEFYASLAQFTNSTITYTIEDLVSNLNSTILHVLTVYPPTDTETYDKIQDELFEMQDAVGADARVDSFSNVLSTLATSIYQSYGVEAPEAPEADAGATSTETFSKYGHVFRVLFVYFFVTLGLTILLMNLLNYLSISHKTRLSRGAWLRLSFNNVIGVTLCALAGMARKQAALDWIASPWALPTVAIALFAMLGVNNVRRGEDSRKEVGEVAYEVQGVVGGGEGGYKPQVYEPYGVAN